MNQLMGVLDKNELIEAYRNKPKDFLQLDEFKDKVHTWIKMGTLKINQQIYACERQQIKKEKNSEEGKSNTIDYLFKMAEDLYMRRSLSQKRARIQSNTYHERAEDKSN